MTLSISTSFDYDLPLDLQLPLIAEAGFSFVSLGSRPLHSGYISRDGRKRIKELLRQNGLKIDTIHGPGVYQPGALDNISTAAQVAAELSVPIVVTHASPFEFPPAELPSRIKDVVLACEALEAVAEETGIIIALENVLPGAPTELVRQSLLHLDPTHFGFCYDSSHDQIDGPRPFDLLAELSDRLVALHISDRIAPFIDHLVPGEGFIDWNRFARTLCLSQFNRPLLLEVMVTHSVEKDPRLFLQLAYERGKWLRNLVASHQDT